jgi:hypothetical protein
MVLDLWCMQDYWDDRACLHCPSSTNTSPPLTKLSAEEIDYGYQTSLASIRAAQEQHLLCSRSRRGISNISSEFSTFLATSARPGRDTWETCTDMEVLVFLEGHYLADHEGRDGGLVAPSTLRQAVSHLSRCFSKYQRTGPWTVLPGTELCLGCPTSSQEVADFLTMFCEQRTSAGYSEMSATPLLGSHYEQLMDGMLVDYNSLAAAWSRDGGTGADLVRCARDGAMFSCLWHSCRRGQDVLNLVWEGLHDHTTQEGLISCWLAAARSGKSCLVPACVLASPRQTKTEHTTRPGTLVFQREPPERSAFCACTWLARLVTVAVACQAPCSWVGPIFLGFTTRDSGVLSSSALGRCLYRACGRHLNSVTGGRRHYSPHSFRRGRLQHEHSRGVAPDELMALAGLRSREILYRYLDLGRHL